MLGTSHSLRAVWSHNLHGTLYRWLRNRSRACVFLPSCYQVCAFSPSHTNNVVQHDAWTREAGWHSLEVGYLWLPAFWWLCLTLTCYSRDWSLLAHASTHRQKPPQTSVASQTWQAESVQQNKPASLTVDLCDVWKIWSVFPDINHLLTSENVQNAIKVTLQKQIHKCKRKERCFSIVIWGFFCSRYWPSSP